MQPNIVDYSDYVTTTDTERNERCAPGRIYEDYSCFTFDELIILVKTYNFEYQDDPINIDFSIQSLNDDLKSFFKKYMIKALKKKLKKECKNHLQILDKFSSKYSEIKSLYNALRPPGPSKKYEWLSNINIDDVLRQYEKEYENDPDKKFFLFPTMPIDFINFHPYNSADKSFFLDKNINNYHHFVSIFNLDSSDQSGSHWISLFIDTKKKQICFFDSTGNPPPRQVSDFINSVNSFYNNSLVVKINSTEHQKGNSECGVYSIYFMDLLIHNYDFDDINKKRISDDKVNQLRLKYFVNTKF